MKRDITIIIAFIFCLLLAYFLGAHFAKKPSVTKYELPKQMPEETQAVKVKTYQDSAGKNHVVFVTVPEMTKAQALKQTSSLVPYIDSVAMALNIKNKQLESSSTITSTVSADSIKFLKVQVDSLKRLVYYYSDKYLKLTVRTGSSKDTTLDSANFDFAYNADLKIYQYWKRKQVLGMNIGSKQHFTDISSTDPRTTIDGLKTFTVKQNLPSVGFRFQAVANYSILNKTISPGIGFRFDYDRLSLNGTYNYNPTLNQWRPVIGIRYDIIQF